MIMTKLQTLFICTLVIQFAVIVSHDLLNIPGWTHGSQVQLVIGRRKLLLATLINAIFPGVAVGLGFWFWNRPAPAFAANYWISYCAITVLFAITMWYLPYFFGTSEQ